jgi:hypothetical protein
MVVAFSLRLLGGRPGRRRLGKGGSGIQPSSLLLGGLASAAASGSGSGAGASGVSISSV